MTTATCSECGEVCRTEGNFFHEGASLNPSRKMVIEWSYLVSHLNDQDLACPGSRRLVIIDKERGQKRLI